MKKKIVFVLVTVIVMAIVLPVFVGCGGNSNALRIALDDEDRNRYNELFDYFTSTTGIEVEATYGKDVSKLIGTKQEPDIIKTSTVVVTSMKDSLLDLSSLIANDPEIDTANYLDTVMDPLIIDDKVYALPTSINTSLLYYNKKLFDESASELRQAFGLSTSDSVYPKADWTYDDYKKAGLTLTKYTTQGDKIKYTQFGAESQIDWWGEWLVYVNQMGGSFYVPGTNNTKCNINSPEAIAATQFFVDKSMGDTTQKFSPDAIENVAYFSFRGGNVAMIFGGHLGDWYSYDGLNMDWDIQVLPTPVGMPDARGGEISADAFGISVRSNKVDAAFKFLKLWASEAGALQMYKYGKIGALKNMEELILALPQSEQKNINISAVFDAVDKAMVLPNEENFSKVLNEMVMTEIYKLMYRGRGSRSDVAEVLNDIKTTVDNFYEGLN